MSISSLTPLQKFILTQQLTQAPRNSEDAGLRQLLMQLLMQGEGGGAGGPSARGPQTAGEAIATAIGNLDPSMSSRLGYDARRGLAAGKMFGETVATPSSIAGRIAAGVLGKPTDFDTVNAAQLGSVFGAPEAINTETAKQLGSLGPVGIDAMSKAYGSLENAISQTLGSINDTMDVSTSKQQGLFGSLMDALGLSGIFGGGPQGGVDPGVGWGSATPSTGFGAGEEATGGLGGPGGPGGGYGGPGGPDGEGPSGEGRGGDTDWRGGVRRGTPGNPARSVFGAVSPETAYIVPDYMFNPGNQGNEDQVRRAMLLALMRLNGGFNGRNG